MNAFMTGSQVYGTPTAKSDVDVVVLVEEDEADRWREVFGELGLLGIDGDAASGGDLSIRSGKINLIVETDPKEFEAWRTGTAELIGRAPVTREQAVQTLRAHRRRLGLGPEPEEATAAMDASLLACGCMHEHDDDTCPSIPHPADPLQP
jgi:hypothetical protein